MASAWGASWGSAWGSAWGSIAVTFSLDASPASYTYTGVVASLNYLRLFNTAAGLYSHSGAGSLILRTRLYSVGVGSYLHSGGAARVPRTRIYLLAPVSFTLTGSEAQTLRQKAVLAASASYTVTGAASRLLRTRLFNMQTGAVEFTGFSTTLHYGIPSLYVLEMLPGSYGLVGVEVKVGQQRVVKAQAGAVTVTGAPTTFLYFRTMLLQAGSYQEAGHNALLTKRNLYHLLADSSSYTVAGAAAWTVKQYALLPEGGTFLLNGIGTDRFRTWMLNAASNNYLLEAADAKFRHYVPLDGFLFRTLKVQPSNRGWVVPYEDRTFKAES